MRRFGVRIILLICLVPYLGFFGFYNTVVAVVTLLILGVSLEVGKFNKLSFGAAGLVVFSILTSALISIEQGKEINLLSFTDFAFVSLWLSLTAIMGCIENDERFFSNTIIVLTAIGVINLLACGLLRIGLFDSSIYYGETASYDQSYAAIRSIGVIGQPGKMALFSAFSIFCLAIGHSKTPENAIKHVAIVGVAAFLLSAFFSFSRTGLILSITALLAFKSTVPQLLITFLTIIAFAVVDDEMISLLMRGTDSEVLNVSSLNNRNVLREKAAEIVLSDPVSFMFGFGPSKESADRIPLPILGHSLRYPDSSLTLIVFRYGLFGLIAALYTLYSVVKTFNIKHSVFKRVNGFVFIVMCAVALCLDPVWHDPKVLIIFMLSLKMLAPLRV